MSVADAFKRVPKLQSQLNALLNCKVCLTTTSVILPKKMRGHLIGNNQLLVYIFMLLLKDSLVLYPILNDGVIFLIDRVSKMKKKEVQKVLDIYSLFVKETDAIISLYEIAKSFAQNLPVIHKVCWIESFQPWQRRPSPLLSQLWRTISQLYPMMETVDRWMISRRSPNSKKRFPNITTPTAIPLLMPTQIQILPLQMIMCLPLSPCPTLLRISKTIGNQWVPILGASWPANSNNPR